MTDTDETITDDDLDLSPITFPERNRLKQNQKVMLPDGSTTEIPIHKPEAPAPKFHDTPDETEIDESLAIANVSLRNLGEMWKAVRTVEQACALADKTCKVLEHRRRLANKQLGKEVSSGGKGTIYHIPD